jgi:hypothetical protein
VFVRTSFVLVLGCIMAACAQGQPHLVDLLRSDEWRKRDTATAIIRRETNYYRDSIVIREAVLDLFAHETEYVKRVFNEEIVADDPGHTEYLRELLFLIIDLDMPEAVPYLVDWSGTGDMVAQAVAAHLIEEPDSSTTNLILLKDRLESDESFCRFNRMGYLRVVEAHLDGIDRIGARERPLLRQMVIGQIHSPDHTERKLAVQLCRHFMYDADVIEVLRELSCSDPYEETGDTVLTYPIREAACAVLTRAGKR